MMSVLLCLGLLVTGVLSGNTLTECEFDNEYHIELMGNSGQFAYKPCNESEDTWLKIRIDSVTEYKPSGQKTNNKVTSFAGGDWDSEDGDEMYAHYNVTRSTKNGDIVFTLYTRILDFDDVVDLGGDDYYTADGGELKWGFTVDNWRFYDDDNHLSAVFHFDAKGDSDDDVDDDDNIVGGFPILSPDFATVNGNSRVNVTVTREMSGGGKKATYTVDVDYYGDNAFLDYDPVVGPMIRRSDGDGDGDGNGDGNSSNGLSAAAIVGIAVGVFVAMAIVSALLYFAFGPKNKAVTISATMGKQNYDKANVEAEDDETEEMIEA